MLYRLSYQSDADTRDRTRDLQIFSLTLSQLSYIGERETARREKYEIFVIFDKMKSKKGGMGELNPRPLLP